ncbi:hypothetical protein BJF88_01565 [Cellulosimicrobium sp. CUA-896]|nr:hypothetical protein BJF88_01565 [Cellulosimicrobium sp. CUA-896]
MRGAQQLPAQREARLAGLGVAGREHDDAPHPEAVEAADGLDRLGRSQGQDGELDRARHLGERRVRDEPRVRGRPRRQGRTDHVDRGPLAARERRERRCARIPSSEGVPPSAGSGGPTRTTLVAPSRPCMLRASARCSRSAMTARERSVGSRSTLTTTRPSSICCCTS